MERRSMTVDGIVQGVGFRPFVYRLAGQLSLAGWVSNVSGRVRIEVEGEPENLERFTQRLRDEPPPLARIEQVWWERIALQGDQAFVIHQSNTDQSQQVFVSPDVATCDECLAEVFDPNDRRYRYPFNNCTNCGPRLTIISASPYDRPNTTMAGFPMCPRCQGEYEDPTNRRYHAQPIACPDCGPWITAVTNAGDGPRVGPDRALEVFADHMLNGRIGALKGLGGYHLVCDAHNDAAVDALRQRKHREEKPLAVMVQDVEAAKRWCEVSSAEGDLLESVRRPIVLLKKRGDTQEHDPLAKAIAPGNPMVGMMLPYTPLHHLLLREVSQRCAGPDAQTGVEAGGGRGLVMTSGNRTDEPIAYDDEEALERLGPIADIFLMHNRPIRVRCDDSVTRMVGGSQLPLRRSRGDAPQPITLPFECPQPILAVGGQRKNTFALTRGHHAFLSQHMGDLDHFEAYRAFERDVPLYEQLLQVQPQVIACDMHPDYASTRYAEGRVHTKSKAGNTKSVQNQKSQRPNDLDSQASSVSNVRQSSFGFVGDFDVRLSDFSPVRVQHHHAHLASCMAEHQRTEPTIGVTFDGTGFGPDGAVWGGEVLVGDCGDFQRAVQLRYVPMPGGERAIGEPWRMAAAHLLDAGLDPPRLLPRISESALGIIRQMIERGFNCPLTSSAGRLFDAVASLIGLRDRVSYEGQAAIELERLALAAGPDGPYPFEMNQTEAGQGRENDARAKYVVDTRALIQAVIEDMNRGTSPQKIARRFHSTLVELILSICQRLGEERQINTVALTGGVFANVLLTQEVEASLRSRNFDVLRHRLVPPGDGGLALGQAAVAGARLTVNRPRRQDGPFNC